jgi:hypothetical protein
VVGSRPPELQNQLMSSFFMWLGVIVTAGTIVLAVAACCWPDDL